MLTMLLGLLFAQPAFSQDTVEIGVIRDEDVHVVQRMLYPKESRSELGLHVGVMPFDAYLWTPNLQLSYDNHFREQLGFSLIAGGGWGFKTGAYRELEAPSIGVAPYAFRYLGSLLGGLEWAPIYAKMNVDGARVIHFDVYGVARIGASVEQSVIPSGGIAVAPTVSPGLGMRLFLGERTALRVELRDDLLVEYRKITQSTEFKQNANVTVGLSTLSKRPERR